MLLEADGGKVALAFRVGKFSCGSSWVLAGRDILGGIGNDMVLERVGCRGIGARSAFKAWLVRMRHMHEYGFDAGKISVLANRFNLI